MEKWPPYNYSPPVGAESQKRLNPFAPYNPSEFSVPFFKRERITLANKLADRINTNADLMNKSTDFGEYISLYIDNSLNAECLEKIRNSMDDHRYIPFFDYDKFQEEFQWHLRNCMERNKNRIIRDANGLYLNWPEKTQEECQKFRDNFDKYILLFNDGTKSFAHKMMLQLRQCCGIPSLGTSQEQPDIASDILDSLDFDRMDGTDFEYFCADVLRGNGYQNVIVTKRSGDQGADVIAERDDVRYAFQCKRYDGNVGNAAVQEALAGKKIYKCHVGVVLTNSEFTQSAIEAATSTDIILWNRSMLLHLIEKASSVI